MKIIRKQCQILTTLVLVDVNRNISYKGRLFETKQAEHRKKTITICSNMYQTIKNEVDILNDQFRSQSQEVLFAWKLHLASVDTLILQSLLQCVKISLHTLYNAINGHEIGGESHPLFSVSILLKNGAIECRPSMINVTNSINIVAKEMMSLTKSMKRMSLQLHNGDKENFYDDISSNNDVLDIIVQIMKGTSCCVTSVGEKLLQWESYRSLWDMDKDSFLRRYSKSKENSFESEVMKYQDLESSIKRERTIVSTGFIQMNFSTLKSDLVSHSVEFQQKLLDLLEKKTKDHLLNLHIFLDDNILKLKRPINSLADLCAITILLIPVERKCNALSDDIPPLERTHSFLRKQGKVYINSEQEKMVKSLKPKQKELIDSIQDAKEMKDKTKIGIKAEFQATVLSHNEKKLKLCHRLEEAFSSSETATSTHAQIWIDSILTEIQSLKTREENLQKGLEFFGMDMATSQRLEDLKANLNLMQNVLYNHDSWRIKWKEWLQVSLASLKIEEMEESSIFFTKELTKAQKGIRQWSPWKCFCQELEDFNRIFPLIQCLLNPALRQRHWRKLERAICRKLNFSPDAFTVNDIFLLGLQRHSKLIFDLVTQANNELTIEYTLKDMESRLSQTMIDITEYKDTFKICATDDLLTKIEDDMMSLQSVKSSAFVTAFHIQVEAHEKDLNKVLECIEKIIGTQRQWLYLENIFMVSDGDIDSQLPQQCKNFADVNRKYKTVMKQIHDVKQVKSISNQNLLQTLEYMTVQMEEIQKALDNYLELKRQVFPRFYFISDDDLLELIGKSKEPCFVQKHMKKCFEGANSLIMKANDVDEEGYHVAIGVRASDGEVINFVENVAVEGSVEFWFGKVLEAIQLGVKQALHDCFKDLKLLKRELWIQKWHGQVLITAGSVAWAKSCHRALQTIKSGKDRYALRIYRKKQISNLRRLSAMVIETSQEKIQHSKIVTLITVEVHNRDVVEKLMKNGCQDPNDFTWKSQLRFNMEHDGKLNRCIVNQMNNTLDFGYEYQGNNGRLVVTPLTERCVLTLITAKSLHRGGNPLGPAGTGKTETVKDLAKNLAYFCVILNCSETMDVKSVGRIFAGLCQSGSWGCFDEFNRMKIEVLSVVATQIGAIFNAIRCNQSSFHFMGKDIKCSAKTGIFITTNPGYAGRHELPENLKALMRPVAMMAPDIILISEVTLSSQGFSESRSLSKKIIALYKLMQQQLSQQLHYDYGLRNIKSVLILAGSIKRMQNDIINEETVILQAIKCINEPKLTNDDMQLFQLLLCDLFSKREPTKHDQEGRLHKAIDEVLCEKGLQTNINMITKTMQLANIMKVRQCNMIIGETLTGKTSIWKTLSLAKQLVHPESDDYVPSVVKFVINPKALTVEELYGSYDNATFEWKDGVLSTIFKHCSEGQKQDIQKWIVFDGPIDALWVESMNSVMDDNKTLTLVNGDRIPLTSTMSLLFETDSLQAASPATVSRAGMVYVNGGIEWTSLVQNWVQKHNKLEEHRVFFEDLCKKVSAVMNSSLAPIIIITYH
jgi:dynein heavy chain